MPVLRIKLFFSPLLLVHFKFIPWLMKFSSWKSQQLWVISLHSILIFLQKERDKAVSDTCSNIASHPSMFLALPLCFDFLMQTFQISHYIARTIVLTPFFSRQFHVYVQIVMLRRFQEWISKQTLNLLSRVSRALAKLQMSFNKWSKYQKFYPQNLYIRDSESKSTNRCEVCPTANRSSEIRVVRSDDALIHPVHWSPSMLELSCRALD